MLATIVEIVLLILIIIDILKEKKLIAFEDKVLDKAAKVIAQIVVVLRRKGEHR